MALGKMIDTKLPVAEMIFCAGFILVYFIERLVRFLVQRRDERTLKTNETVVLPPLEPDNDGAQVRKNSHSSSLVNELGHFFIIVALSFHSIFEGLAIGLQSDTESVWLLFVGVGTHKFLIAFCLGMELFTSGQQTLKMALGYLLTFAVMSPIGIALGIAVTEEIANDPGTQAAVVGILQARPCKRHPKTLSTIARGIVCTLCLPYAIELERILFLCCVSISDDDSLFSNGKGVNVRIRKPVPMTHLA
jgi:zinc transporter ZupT